MGLFLLLSNADDRLWRSNWALRLPLQGPVIVCSRCYQRVKIELAERKGKDREA